MAQSNEDGPLIGPHTTVRESVQRYPGLEAVFDKHGLGGCGGPDGPIEPIAFFARIHQVDPPALLRELNEFAARRDGAAAIPLMDERPKQATQPYFIGLIASLANCGSRRLSARHPGGTGRWSGHRSGDALVARGYDVRHIISATKADPHRMTPFAHVKSDVVTYPPLP